MSLHIGADLGCIVHVGSLNTGSLSIDPQTQNIEQETRKCHQTSSQAESIFLFFFYISGIDLDHNYIKYKPGIHSNLLLRKIETTGNLHQI